MKRQNTIAGLIAFSTIAAGGAASAWAGLTDNMTANGDTVSITLPNAQHPERVGKTVIDLTANDDGPIDKSATKLMEPDSGNLVNSLTFGKTTLNIKNGILTIDYSGESQKTDIPEKINYVIYNSDKTLEMFAPIDFTVNQVTDANAPESFKAVDDTITDQVNLKQDANLQINLLKNDIFDPNIVPKIHLIDPVTGDYTNSFTTGKLTYSVDDDGIVKITGTAPLSIDDFKNFKYSITETDGITSDANVKMDLTFITVDDNPIQVLDPTSTGSSSPTTTSNTTKPVETPSSTSTSSPIGNTSTTTPTTSNTRKPTDSVTSTSSTTPSESTLHFKNCDEAKAAGYHDILAGTPGYSKNLDRDNDGVACEDDNPTSTASSTSQPTTTKNSSSSPTENSSATIGTSLNSGNKTSSVVTNSSGIKTSISLNGNNSISNSKVIINSSKKMVTGPMIQTDYIK